MTEIAGSYCAVPKIYKYHRICRDTGRQMQPNAPLIMAKRTESSGLLKQISEIYRGQNEERQ